MAQFHDLPRALRARGLEVAVVVMAVGAAGAVVTLLVEPVDPLPHLVVALVLGVLLGTGYAAVQAGDAAPRGLSSPEELEQRHGVPVFAVAASDRLAHGAGRRFGSASSDHVDPEVLVSEDFRRIRADLVGRTDVAVGVLAVTSPRSGNGTSTVALAVAATYAASGQRVVLVDGDLRNPGVAHALGLIEEVGLSDVLTGRLPLEDALQPTVIDRLEVLAAGSVLSDPTGFVGSEAMRGLLTALSREAFVVVDAPPMHVAADSAALGAVADGVLVVARANGSTDAELRAGLTDLEAAGARLLAVVVNWSGRDSAS